jgi:subtilisin family serine protease
MRAARALLFASALALQACVSGGSALRVPLSPEMRAEPASFVVVTVRNVPRALATEAGSIPRGYDAAGMYGVTNAASEAVHGLERDYGLREVSAWPITTLRVHCIVFRVPAPSTPATVMAHLMHDSRVESVQLLNEFATQGSSDTSVDYNDPYAGLQLSLRELDVVAAHHWSRGAGVRLALIDTGVDFEHPDLKGRVIERRNFVDGDERSFRLDRHGTEVAGVIAAVADNDVGIVGVAPESRVLALKACWHTAQAAARAVCNSFTLAQALEAAIVARVDVVNLSLAGPPDPLLERLVQHGMALGILFVGAVAPHDVAGGFPAGIRGVLAVDSAEDASGDSPNLLAPGHEVLTLIPGGRWDFVSGSSFAAAEVSGTLALLLAEQRHLSGAEAQRILTRTSRNVTTPTGAVKSIDACAALALLLRHETCESSKAVQEASQPSASVR